MNKGDQRGQAQSGFPWTGSDPRVKDLSCALLRRMLVDQEVPSCYGCMTATANLWKKLITFTSHTSCDTSYSNLSKWPTWCTNFNIFITILYMYMFRAISCSSSGGQIVLIQHLVSSLSVSDCPVHRCTGRSLTESDDARCCINP